MSAEIAERALAEVQQDVEDGMGRWFDSGGDRGFVAGPDLETAVPVVADDRFGTVAWEFTGMHTNPIAGIAATRRRVTVRGVTIVDLDKGDEPLFHRYVDWNGVAAQLGLAVSARPIVSVEPDLDQPQEPDIDGDGT